MALAVVGWLWLFVVFGLGFFLWVTWIGAAILPCFSFVSGQQGLHHQGEMREGIRILKANILPLGVMQAVLVFTEAPFVVTGEMRKINDRLRSERPPINRSSLHIYGFIFAKETRRTLAVFTTGMRLKVITVFLVLRNHLSSCIVVCPHCPASEPQHVWSACNWMKL